MKRKYQKLIQRPNLKQKKTLVENFGAVKEAYLEIIDENKDLVKQLECKISTMDNNTGPRGDKKNGCKSQWLAY